MTQLKSLQTALKEEEKLRLLSSLGAKWDRWSSSAQLQARARSQRMEEKRYQEERKKKLHEQRRSELEAEQWETRETSSRYWREMENKAEENKALRATNESVVSISVWECVGVAGKQCSVCGNVRDVRILGVYESPCRIISLSVDLDTLHSLTQYSV